MTNFSPCPIFHDLSQYSKEDLDLDAVWEIPVPMPDIFWTIVLAYCSSASSESILSRCLTKIGAEKVGKKIRNSIKHYNPFLHRNTCFHDERFNALVETFRKQIGKTCNRDDDWIQNVIETASDLLSCKIIALYHNWTIDYKDIIVFPNTESQKYHDRIFIFINQKKSEEVSFSFGMLQEFALSKRKSALKCLLDNIGLEQDVYNKIINQFLNSPDNNFPLLILKDSQNECISKIYKSEYILAKLQDAAFDLDPQKDDKHGKSALYYSLLMKDPTQFYVLHEYAANAGGSLRSPDPNCLKSSHQLKKHLEKLHLKVENEGISLETKKECRKKLKEISLFNEFLIIVCTQIFELNTSFEMREHSIINEANHRKCVMLSIVGSYNIYFGGFGVARDDLGNESAEYPKYGNYFDRLDLFVALLFFDNLFLLKERISIPDKKYSKVESQFYSFFHFKRKFFEKFKREDLSNQLLYRTITFQMRLLLQTELNSFAEHLERINISEAELNKSLPRSDVGTLTNSFEVHNEFIVYKIEYYLDVATEMKVKDIKSVLVIEKCLHLLGEYLKENENYDSIKKVLAFALPKELVLCLNKFRKKITHTDKISTTRISAEKDLELFKRIQLELKSLQEILKPIFCAQKFWAERYYHQVNLDTVRQLQGIKLEEKDILQIMDFLSVPAENRLGKPFEEFKITLKKHFIEFYNSFSNRNVHVCKEQSTKKNSKFNIYKWLFSNIFSGAEKQLKIYEHRPIEINKLKDYFWSMDYLLYHIIENEPRETIRTQFSKIVAKKTNIFSNLNVNYSESLVRDIKQVFLEYTTITTKILPNFGNTSSSIQIDFKNIKQLSCTAFLNTTEQKIIHESVPSCFKTVHNSKSLITFNLSNQQTSLPNQRQVLQQHLTNLNLKWNNNKFILENQSTNPKMCIQKINQVKDYYGMLRKAIDECELSSSDFKLLCEKLILPEYSKDILSKIVKVQNQKIQGNKLKFLRSRIQYLKEILVDENKDIKLLWKISKSQKSFLYIQERVIQTYLSDPDVQVSVEMLLFDCMNIMKPEQKQSRVMKPEVYQHLVYLWRKSNNLLKGICLRNVLAHGDPLPMNSLLDKEDLPRELVTRMLQLVKDGAILDHMLDAVSEIGTDPKDFANFMNAKNTEISPKLSKICEKIKSYERWRDYATFVSSELITDA